ncbi:hypothetical protein D7S86_15495 [Pararobbsia silviterrae]|uniref:Uncharacterized protein n=2 Tax=Pararobbsia silviterrae TaxID=1792498 RepID=A0A494XSQ0_9BURK|nr:hypothetical protein D7S86_15495 [Pararobbsia silviterrae]
MRVARAGAHVSSIRDNALAVAEMTSAIDAIEDSYGPAAKVSFVLQLIEQFEARGAMHLAEELHALMAPGSAPLQIAAR